MTDRSASRRKAEPSRVRPTLTETARREQLIGLTIALVAEHGYAAVSLSRIADAARISKAAVLYYFSSKNAVIEAAYRSVIQSLTDHLGERITAAADPAAAIDAYISGMIGYMADHPDHMRIIIEALGNSAETAIDDLPTSASRWGFLAELIQSSQSVGTYTQSADPQMQAIMISGAIDAVVAQAIHDPQFDLHHAADAVVVLSQKAALNP